MKRDIIKNNIECARKGFLNYVHELAGRQQGDGKKSLGDTMLDIWNAWCDDRGNEFDKVFDLTDDKDLTEFLIACRELVYRNKDLEFFNAHYAFVASEGVSETRYVLLADDELEKYVYTELEAIVESAIVFPHSYPEDFYYYVVWPIIRNEMELLSHDI